MVKAQATKAAEETAAKNSKGAQLVIQPPNFQIAEFRIRGTAPYVQNKFSAKAREAMKATQEAGQTGKKGKAKVPKDFQASYKAAMHRSGAGWHGIPAPAFRNAMISACKAVGFHMTKAKLSVFAMADGIDVDDGTPLVKISKGKPAYHEGLVRLASGVCDIRPRPMWPIGWEAQVRIRFDADQFTLTDVANLMVRAGIQVGIGEGRPDSKSSCGCDWGTFEVLGR